MTGNRGHVMRTVASQSYGSARITRSDLRRGADRKSALVTVALLGFGGYLVTLSLWMLVDPSSWFSTVGPFGRENDHFIRDGATFQLVFGLGALGAVWFREWRPLVLVAIALQTGLHALNHLADIGSAHPHWVGFFDFIALTVSAVSLAVLARWAMHERSAQR